MKTKLCCNNNLCCNNANQNINFYIKRGECSLQRMMHAQGIDFMCKKKAECCN